MQRFRWDLSHCFSRRFAYVGRAWIFFSFLLHWLVQVNGLQMVAAAAVAIFNTEWSRPILTLTTGVSCDSLSSGATQQDTLQLRGRKAKTQGSTLMLDNVLQRFSRSNKARIRETDEPGLFFMFCFYLRASNNNDAVGTRLYQSTVKQNQSQETHRQHSKSCGFWFSSLCVQSVNIWRRPNEMESQRVAPAFPWSEEPSSEPLSI